MYLNLEVPATYLSSLGSSDPRLVLLWGGSAHDCGIHRVTGGERRRKRVSDTPKAATFIYETSRISFRGNKHLLRYRRGRRSGKRLIKK